MPMTSLVMTIIGKDRPGLVESVAETIVKHKGNWLESRMCRLGGEFAGILRFEIPAENQDSLTEDIRKLSSIGLSVVVQPDSSHLDEASTKSTVANLEIVGHDRPGIVHQISSVLAKYGVNFEELITERDSAPMSGELLFKARALLKIPNSCDLKSLKNDLEKISNELMVDAILQPRM
ncbi:MAG: glycine cleavage system protein R [Limisphaerales bacterium]|jgi:glycine cleavage system regulatory protein